MPENTQPLVQIVAVEGRGVVPSTELVVTADDLGLTRGDGCFDATRVLTDENGRSVVEHLDEHLARFNRSIQGLGDEPDDLARWQELVADAVADWTVPGEATLKVMYTRGTETVASEPTRLLTITPLSPSAVEQRDGIGVVLLPKGVTSDACADAPWLLGGVKTLSYAVNKASLREAARRGADDVVWTSSDGYLLEGPTSSLVVWTDEGLVTTPTGATGILDSITQRTVFAAAEAEGVACTHRLLRPEELATARGSWLLSSVRGAAPILSVDGVAVPHDEELSRRVAGWAGF